MDISETILGTQKSYMGSNPRFESGHHRNGDLAVPVESQVIALPIPPEGLDDTGLGLSQQPESGVEKLTHGCQLGSEMIATKSLCDRQLEQFISNLLKYGVLLASILVSMGGILYLIRHGSEPADYRFFQGTPSEFCSLEGIVTAVLSGSSRGLIQLGLLILIVTPIARVAFSFLAFLRQRDFAYILITLCVLAGLIYSLIGAYT